MISLEEKIEAIKKMSKEEMLTEIRQQKFTQRTFHYMNLVLGNRDYCEMLNINHPNPTKEDYFKARVLAHYFETGGK